MKKLILATACAVASGTIFANSPVTAEQRINLLETELQKLKAELEAQKLSQNNLQVKQAKIEENVEKNKALENRETDSTFVGDLDRQC